MGFKSDKQTLEDLNILGKTGTSVFNLYNDTYTHGGAEILETMFLFPLNDVASINIRSGTFQYFNSFKIKFPVKAEWLDSANTYLSLTDKRTKLSDQDNNLMRKLSSLISSDGNFKLIYNGIIAILEILQETHRFIKEIAPTANQSPYKDELAVVVSLLSEDSIRSLINEKERDKLPYLTIVKLDELIRFGSAEKILQVLNFLYHLDVYLTVAGVAAKYTFRFPKAIDTAEPNILLTGVYHPLVKNAVANTVNITAVNNVVFLTGANMAGKSTFMKALGIAVYLAHMGFPVAASHMEFSLHDGIFTTINLSDDLSSGNSHFYAEVLRLKKVAKELGGGKKLFVMFDELFRGTNVKDAYEGTIAITQAFADKRNCLFVISTHITEAGEVLRKSRNTINFVRLPSVLENNVPQYTYKLEAGITADRHGMFIINNENILEIIRSRKNKTTAS